jgi:HSP20 family protein
MQIVRFEPFREIAALQDSFNRLLGETFARGRADSETQQVAWAPAVDIFETNESLVLKAEIPGVKPEDVDIRVEDNTLYLRGERRFEREVKEENFHRVERSYGTFSRTFTLPASVDSEKIKAEYKDGLLVLTMPKREEAKPKTIKIDVSKN